MKDICQAITEATGKPQELLNESTLGGGCIRCLQTTSGTWFVKLNSAAFIDIFAIEAEALNELRQTQTIRVPQPITHGVSKGNAFLVLEYIEFGSPKPDSHANAGKQLAALHKHTVQQYGWKHDNVIGSTPQKNPLSDSWPEFFRDHRLGYQFDLAQRSGKTFSGQEALMEQIREFFKDYTPEPSLLHGDLWGGNMNFDAEGNPVIFDPATYYGDRETDIAFTEMFGGFRREFYDAYNQAWPLDSGYNLRKDLYNLYHYLNHHNLFGGGYASTAQALIDRLLQAL
jgi:protein-ribulosamine 3-kinase